MRSICAPLIPLRGLGKVARLVVGAFTLLALPGELYALSFVQQPQGGTRYPGDGFLLSCIVTDVPPPAYQWYQDGNPLAGATNSQVLLTNLTSTSTGNYTAVASTESASITSAPAALLVLSDTDITGTIQDVRHIVILMQENRSFDHYFGSLKGVRGFSDRSTLRFQNGNNDFFQPNGSNYVLPFHITAQCLNDVEHDWDAEHQVWHSGRWDRWISADGTSAMAYYNRADLPYYYALAEAYTICDDYHCSVMGPTFPNRLYLFTGMIDPNNTGGGPVTENFVPASGYTWTTYPERLQANGVSWKVYRTSGDWFGDALPWFSQYMIAAPGNPLYDRGVATVPDVVAAFQQDVANGTLPRVSWIMPPYDLSEHPFYSPANGERLTKQLLDALASNPAVYNSTVFILTYDEAGGFFDHVPPPVPSPGTPNEFVSGSPIGLGVRVPAILVSPWTRGGYVCSQVSDHTSIIRLLEAWTGVQEPNISAWRRQVCGDLTSAFNFTNPDASYPSLPSTAAINCSGGITPSVPSQQSVPTQETGLLAGRPLPYQPNATSTTDCGLSRFWIAMTNAGVSSIHFAIYPDAYRTDGPWQYDVGAGNVVSDSFSVVSSGGRYDLTCYGPNGFQRRFAGNINSNCSQIEVVSSIETNLGGIMLALQNLTATTVVFTVTNGYPTGGPWTYNVPAASTVTDTFPAVANNYGWYDLTATASSDPLFLRRFAGHIETAGIDFALAVAPNLQAVTIGSNATFTVNVGTINGFTGEVALNATGLPENVTASFSPATVSGSGMSTLSLTISTNTPPGSYPVTVTGTSSNTTHTAIVTLTINTPDFSLLVTPTTRTATAGSNTAYTLNVGATNGFTGDVMLSVTGLPANVSADFNPASVTGSGTVTLSLATSTNSPPGSYPLTVMGTSSNVIHMSAVTLTINAPDPVIPEWWMQQYFGCTTCSQAGAAADPDGDGMNNIAEFLSGTDPTNGASAFRIMSVTPQGADVLVTWQTHGGKTNAVQAAPNLGSSYGDVSSNIILPGSGDLTTNFLDIGAATTNASRFYRVRLVP
jgi:phospholipase C